MIKKESQPIEFETEIMVINPSRIATFCSRTQLKARGLHPEEIRRFPQLIYGNAYVPVL